MENTWQSAGLSNSKMHTHLPAGSLAPHRSPCQPAPCACVPVRNCRCQRFSSATLELRSLTAHSLTGHRMHGAAVNTEQDALLDEYDDEKPSPKRLVVCLDVATLFTTARQHSDRFMYILTVFAALGGFLFGYDTGVVSGAMLLISDEFTLSDVQQVSIVTRTTTNIDIIPHRS